MSLTPIVLTDKFMSLLKFSRTIFWSSYVIMSKLNEDRDQADLTDQYILIDRYFWITFVICLLILSAISFIDKFLFSTLRQINWWTIARILVNQSKKCHNKQILIPLLRLYEERSSQFNHSSCLYIYIVVPNYKYFNQHFN